VRGSGVLIVGPSGSGKSSLALRLLDRGAALITDDYAYLRVSQEVVIARAPEAIAGKIEVRGIGIVDWPHIAETPVRLAVVLDEGHKGAQFVVGGVHLPAIVIDGLSHSAPIKVEIALGHAFELETTG
jgi:serine kinase of HPr protein (carbohydrate metabolism regulator)